jgi:hypothetical protein
LLVMLPYRKVNTRGRNCSTTVLKEKFLWQGSLANCP